MSRTSLRVARISATRTTLVVALAVLGGCNQPDAGVDASGVHGDAGSRPQLDGAAPIPDGASPDGAGIDGASRDSGSSVEVLFTAPPADVTYVRGSVSLQLVIRGATPDSVELWKDGSVFAVLAPPYTYVWDTDTETEAAHDLEARAMVGGVVAGGAQRTFVVDRTPPRIVSRIPDAGSTNASLARPIRVEFSEAVLASSTTGAFDLELPSGALAFTLDVPGPTVLTAQVTAMPPSMPATATAAVHGTITDLAGNALGTDETWSFTYPQWASREGSGIPAGLQFMDATQADDGSVWVVFASATDLRVAGYDASGWHEIAAPRSGAGRLRDARIRTRPSGAVVVAWIGVTAGAPEMRVSEWDGTSWTEYPRPARNAEMTQAHVEMEIEDDGAVVLAARFGLEYVVQRYAMGAWLPVGTSLYAADAMDHIETDLLPTADGLYFSYVSAYDCKIAREDVVGWTSLPDTFTGSSWDDTCAVTHIAWMPGSPGVLYTLSNTLGPRYGGGTESFALQNRWDGTRWNLLSLDGDSADSWYNVARRASGWYALGANFGGVVFDESLTAIGPHVENAVRVLPGSAGPAVVTYYGVIWDFNVLH